MCNESVYYDEFKRGAPNLFTVHITNLNDYLLNTNYTIENNPILGKIHK